MISDILGIIAGVAFFGFTHSFFASLEFKKALAARIGDKMAFYRMFYTVFFTVESLAVLYLIPKIDVKVYDLPFPYDLAVYFIQIAAFAGLVWTGLSFDWKEFIGISQIIRYFKGSYKTEELDEKPEFRISGPFKFMRHPVYFFSIIFLGARPEADVTYLVLFLSSSAYFIIGAYFEEKKLLKIFGETYRRYQKEVPFMFPKLPKKK